VPAIGLFRSIVPYDTNTDTNNPQAPFLEWKTRHYVVAGWWFKTDQTGCHAAISAR
jgi:hypothetical protein